MALVYIALTFIMLIWYVRPIYNFMAKRKYILLDLEQLSLLRRIQTWLPSLAFYALIFGLMFYPAITNNLLDATQTSGILVAQILFIFLLTRFDKWQTKYKVLDEGLRFRRRLIRWDESYTVTFKKSAFLILHKPRFIIKTHNQKIVVPMLSHNIEHFITRISYVNQDLGDHIKELYENTRAYYVKNIQVEKELNKIGSKL